MNTLLDTEKSKSSVEKSDHTITLQLSLFDPSKLQNKPETRSYNGDGSAKRCGTRSSLEYELSLMQVPVEPSDILSFIEDVPEMGPGKLAEQAACNGMDRERFFDFNTYEKNDAREVCRICPVQLPCLKYAIDNNIWDGMWGGLDEDERKLLSGRLSRYRLRLNQLDDLDVVRKPAV